MDDVAADWCFGSGDVPTRSQTDDDLPSPRGPSGEQA